MLDKEKLIIVFHVGVNEMPKNHAVQTIISFKNMEQIQFDESVRTIVVPDETAHKNTVRVEIINPIVISDAEYNDKVVPYCKTAEQAIKDFQEQNK